MVATRDLAGACLSIFGSVVSNFGVNLQKLAHTKNSEKPMNLRKHYTGIPSWWFGLFLVIFGAICDFTALGLANQALVTATGGGTTLVANLFIARVWLKEALSWLDVLGTILIIGGAVTIASIQPESQDYTLDQLLEFAKSKIFIGYVAILLSVIGILIAGIANTKFYHFRKRFTYIIVSPLVKQVDRLALAVTDSKKKEAYLLRRVAELELKYELLEHGSSKGGLGRVGRSRFPRQDTGELMGLLDQSIAENDDDIADQPEVSIEDISNFVSSHLKGAEGEYTKIFDESDKERHWMDAFVYASCSGSIGACSVLLAGMTSKTIILAVNGDNQFDTIWPYLFIVGMIVTILSQTDLLNCALQCGDVMQVFPIFQAFFIGFGTIGGMIFYEQTWVLKETEGEIPGWIIYGLSACSMVSGCFCLMVHGKTEYIIKDEKEKRQEKEERIRKAKADKEKGAQAESSSLNQSITWMRRATVQDIVQMRGPQFMQKKKKKNQVVPQKMTYEELKQKVEPHSPIIQAANKFLITDAATPPSKKVKNAAKDEVDVDHLKMKNELLQAYKDEYKLCKEETKRKMKIELLNLQKESMAAKAGTNGLDAKNK